jgi:hypothetical protein
MDNLPGHELEPADLPNDLQAEDKRAAFSAWAGKRSAIDMTSLHKMTPENDVSDKRAAFSAWTGKRAFDNKDIGEMTQPDNDANNYDVSDILYTLDYPEMSAGVQEGREDRYSPNSPSSYSDIDDEEEEEGDIELNNKIKLALYDEVMKENHNLPLSSSSSSSPDPSYSHLLDMIKKLDPSRMLWYRGHGLGSFAPLRQGPTRADGHSPRGPTLLGRFLVGPDDFSPSKRIFHSWAGKR